MSSEPLLRQPEEHGAPEKPGLGRAVSSSSFEERCTVFSPPIRRCMRRRLMEGAFWLGLPVLLGIAIGLLLPTNQQCPVIADPIDRISSVIGWVYFCMWSISFWPQAYSNWRRKSVAGLSLDFQVLNMLGFGCYAVYNAALFWNAAVRSEYSCTHGGSLPAVHANDVFFAIHAAAATAVTLFQCAVYDRGGQRVSWPAALGTGASLAGVAAYLAAVVGAAAQEHRSPAPGGLGGAGGVGGPAAHCGTILSWLSFLYFLSYIKLAVSLVKYIPQVYLNYKLRSTAGWNMHNVALDFGGGLLSLVQLIIDGAATQDWTAVTGNPVKFALGFASMFFDVIFMVQHFCLYPAHAHGDFWAAAADLEAGAQGIGKGKAAVSALPEPLPSAADLASADVAGAADVAELEAASGSGSGGGGSGSRLPASDRQPLLGAGRAG